MNKINGLTHRASMSLLTRVADTAKLVGEPYYLHLNILEQDDDAKTPDGDYFMPIIKCIEQYRMIPEEIAAYVECDVFCNAQEHMQFATLIACSKLHQHDRLKRITPYAQQNHSKTHRTDVLEWLHTARPFDTYDSADAKFVELSGFTCRYLTKFSYEWRDGVWWGTRNTFAHELFYTACASGMLIEAKWLYTQYRVLRDRHRWEDAFCAACAAGNIDLVIWMLDSIPGIRVRDNRDEAFLAACASGNLQLAQWLVARYPKITVHIKRSKAFREACAGGHLLLAQWLGQFPHVNINSHDADALIRACANGHYLVVKWLIKINPRSSMYVWHAMKTAQRHGRWHIVEFIYYAYNYEIYLDSTPGIQNTMLRLVKHQLLKYYASQKKIGHVQRAFSRCVTNRVMDEAQWMLDEFPEIVQRNVSFNADDRMAYHTIIMNTIRDDDPEVKHTRWLLRNKIITREVLTDYQNWFKLYPMSPYVKLFERLCERLDAWAKIENTNVVKDG